MRKRELLKMTVGLVAKWQTRLLLSDWEFAVAVVEKEDMVIGATGAEIGWDSETMRAEIRVLKDWEDGHLDRLEEVIVHELLHCHRVAGAWDGFKKAERRRLCHLEDKFLDRLGRILVEVARAR